MAAESTINLGVPVGSRRARARAVGAFFRDAKAAVAGVILGALIILAVFAPVFAPFGINDQDTTASLVQPSAEHPLGTDRLGRDILSRLIYGARISLRVGFIAVGIAAVIGLPLGLIAGYAGRWADEVLMRITDAMIAFPNIIFLLGVVAVLGPGVTNVMIAIGISTFPIYARLIRAQTLSLKERDFVLAARSLGASDRRILAQHILPNAFQPIVVQASLALGGAVLAESGLSFLGIGILPPTPTWGVIIAEGFPVIRQNPWISIAPGFFIVAFVLSVNLLGDRLRDVLDPRLRGSR